MKMQKHAMEIGMKIVAGAGLVLALGSTVVAQRASNGGRGQDVVQGSLENDLRPGLVLRPMLGHASAVDPSAVIPMIDDFPVVLMLTGGAAGSAAAIEVGQLVERGHGLAGGAVISGFFGQNGEFVVDLPRELDVRGLGARGAQISGHEVTEVVDLGAAAQAAYASWLKLAGIADPLGAGPGGMHELQRPTLGGGAGMRAPAPDRTVSRTVDIEEPIVEEPSTFGFDKLGEIAPPQSAGTAGGGHELQRPSRGAGNGARADAPGRSVTRSVDLSNSVPAEPGISFDKLDKIAEPQSAGSAGGGRELRRLARRGGHTR